MTTNLKSHTKKARQFPSSVITMTKTEEVLSRHSTSNPHRARHIAQWCSHPPHGPPLLMGLSQVIEAMGEGGGG